MKFVEFMIVFIIIPRICEVKFFVMSQKIKNNAKNKPPTHRRAEEIRNSIENFSECLSMDEFKNYDILRSVQLCSSLSTIEKVPPLCKKLIQNESEFSKR